MTSPARLTLVRDEAPTWDVLVADHYQWVYRRSLLLHRGDRDAAADFAQDVFVRLFIKLPAYRPGNLRAWIRVVMANLFNDQYSYKGRRRTFELTDRGMDSITDTDARTAPMDAIAFRSLTGPVREALNAIRTEYRDVVVLADLEGLSTTEIVNLTGVPANTVRSRLRRGREALRQHLVGAHALDPLDILDGIHPDALHGHVDRRTHTAAA